MFGLINPGQVGKPGAPNYPGYFSQVSLSDSSGSGAELHQFKVTLTATQVKALHGTPIVLIPAPGAGKYVSVVEITGYVNFGSAAYTGANAVEFRYTDGSGSKVTGDAASAWLDSSSSAAVKVIAAAVTPVANAAVVASVPTANPAAGDSTVTFEGFYRVVKLP